MSSRSQATPPAFRLEPLTFTSTAEHSLPAAFRVQDLLGRFISALASLQDLARNGARRLPGGPRQPPLANASSGEHASSISVKFTSVLNKPLLRAIVRVRWLLHRRQERGLLAISQHQARSALAPRMLLDQAQARARANPPRLSLPYVLNSTQPQRQPQLRGRLILPSLYRPQRSFLKLSTPSPKDRIRRHGSTFLPSPTLPIRPSLSSRPRCPPCPCDHVRLALLPMRQLLVQIRAHGCGVHWWEGESGPRRHQHPDSSRRHSRMIRRQRRISRGCSAFPCRHWEPSRIHRGPVPSRRQKARYILRGSDPLVLVHQRQPNWQ